MDPPVREMVPRVWHPYVVQDSLSLPPFRIHGVHNAPGVGDDLLALVDRELSLYAVGWWGFPFDRGLVLEDEKGCELPRVRPDRQYGSGAQLPFAACLDIDLFFPDLLQD